MLKKVVVAVLAVVGVLVAAVAVQPDHYTVVRSAVIPAPPSDVFAVLNGFQHFPDWSPWDKRDPQMKKDLSGPATGVGASYHWKGNSEVGEGRMTIVESVPDRQVAIKLEFLAPFPSVNEDLLTLRPEGTGTLVTWTMNGKLDFMGKAVGLVNDWDKMIGPDFEKGLAALVPVVEHAAAEARAKATEVQATK